MHNVYEDSDDVSFELESAIAELNAAMGIESADDFDMDMDMDDIDDEDITFEDDDMDTLSLTEEAAILLDTIASECETQEEFENLIMESAAEMELYGLIPDAQAAMEAMKVLKIDNWKIKKRNRAVNRECIVLAKNANDPIYKKYKINRDKMRVNRAKIFKKYEAKAKAHVRKAMTNSKAKASSMNTPAGKSLTARLNASMSKSVNGKNPTHAPNKAKAQ